MTKENAKTCRLGCGFYGCLGIFLIAVIFAAVFLGTFYFLYTTGRSELSPYLENSPAEFSSESVSLGEYPSLVENFEKLKKDFAQGKEVSLRLSAPEINSLIATQPLFQHPLFSDRNCKIAVEFPDDVCLLHFSVNVDADKSLLNSVMKKIFPTLAKNFGDENYKFLNGTFVINPTSTADGKRTLNIREIKINSYKKENNDFITITKFLNDALQPLLDEIQIKEFFVKDGVLSLTINKNSSKNH